MTAAIENPVASIREDTAGCFTLFARVSDSGISRRFVEDELNLIDGAGASMASSIAGGFQGFFRRGSCFINRRPHLRDPRAHVPHDHHRHHHGAPCIEGVRGQAMAKH